jgi:hypothetical protein
MLLSKHPVSLFLAAIFVFASVGMITAQRATKSHTPYTIELRALDYFDDGRIVETYKETRYVSATGDWRAVKRYHGGVVHETIGIVGRGVFLVDRKGQKLRYLSPYPEKSPAEVSAGLRRSKQTTLLGYETHVKRIQHGDGVMFVGRASALNGDVVHILTRFPGFSRIVEPVNISRGQPRAAALEYPSYEVANAVQK